MTEQEKLFANFYNSEKVLVKDMDDIQLREHREELRQIAFEAKARAVAADDEDRERKAKKSPKVKEWELAPAGVDHTSTDAINAVKTRAARMSKLEKMEKQLLAAGIDEETVKEMMRNMSKTATESAVKTVTFEKPSVEVSAVTVKVNKPESTATPFDPSTLNFGTK